MKLMSFYGVIFILIFSFIYPYINSDLSPLDICIAGLFWWGGYLKNRFYFLNVSHSLLATTKTDSSAPWLYKSEIIACKVSWCGYI